MGHPSRQITLLLLVAGLALAAACGSGERVAPGEPEGVSPSPTAEVDASPEAPVPSSTAPRTLAAGEFFLPAAGSFGEPGFHEVLTTAQELPADLGPTAGLRLVLALRDAGRPRQTCSQQHPLSGCATVDWSDATSRPKVPPGGVFDNSLTLQLASGAGSLFLSESGLLKDTPDPFRPG